MEAADPVTKMSSGREKLTVEGIPTHCHCGMEAMLAVSSEPMRKGERYLCCFWDLTEGLGRGCGMKQWLVHGILEEFKDINKSRHQIEQSVDILETQTEELQEKTHSISVQLEESRNNYKNLLAKNEALEARFDDLQEMVAKYLYVNLSPKLRHS